MRDSQKLQMLNDVSVGSTMDCLDCHGLSYSFNLALIGRMMHCTASTGLDTMPGAIRHSKSREHPQSSVYP